ncbi:hypothetical protein [Mycobacterium marinum]|uniref:hypothetical protein n=1 Tax=Mycobacterium marinum TaxID=1781 RepID=UPI00356212F6
MLSRLAREFAAEISSHDWSDAPYRLDRAGHQRHWDSRATEEQLEPHETENVLVNVMWVTAQVLRNLDPNLDVHEFAEACGVSRSRRLNSNGKPSGVITHGLRWNGEQPGVPLPPGAPLQCIVMRCAAPNLVVFKRLLKEAGAMNPGLPTTQIEETEVDSAGGALRTVTVFVRDWDSDRAASKGMGMVRRAIESLQGGGSLTLVSATEVACGA